MLKTTPINAQGYCTCSLACLARSSQCASTQTLVLTKDNLFAAWQRNCTGRRLLVGKQGQQ
jgi:hypothetical protein